MKATTIQMENAMKKHEAERQALATMINEKAEIVKIAREMIASHKFLEYGFEYISLDTESELYTPVDAMIMATCKSSHVKQNGQGTTSIFASDLFEITASGKMIKTQKYDDYRQEVATRLFELCLNYPESNFSDLLWTATTEGINTLYNREHKAVQKNNIRKRVRFESMDAMKDGDENGYYYHILKSAYQDTEAEAIGNVITENAVNMMTDRDKAIVAMYLQGYSIKETADIVNVSCDCVKKVRERRKNFLAYELA